jgi:hypothetical protein
VIGPPRGSRAADKSLGCSLRYSSRCVRCRPGAASQKCGAAQSGSGGYVAAKIADESIVSGSLLTVESNHFCVLKSRGAVPDYDTGQYALLTPDKPIIGAFVTFTASASAVPATCGASVPAPPGPRRHWSARAIVTPLLTFV